MSVRDLWAAADSLQRRVEAALVEGRCEFVVIPAEHRIAVTKSDWPKVVQALRSSERELSVTVDRGPREVSPLKRIADLERLDQPGRAWSFTVAGLAHASVDVEFWTEVADDQQVCPDGGTYLLGTRIPSRRNGRVQYLGPGDWAAAQLAPGHWPWPVRSSLFEIGFPIDLVYGWVDGNDAQWQAARAAARAAAGMVSLHSSATSDSRYTDHEELRYSLRSLEAFAGWIRHIYLVTDCQPPRWLRREHPRITVVDHREIFADPSVLPVFNSHAIESQLHHIEGLSEHFLYLNDDMFFARPVRPELFFEANGLPKLHLADQALLNGQSPLEFGGQPAPPVLAAQRNADQLIETLTGQTIPRRLRHVPYALTRSLMYELEERYPIEWGRTAASKFRSPTDWAPTSMIAPFYGYATGRATEGHLAYAYADLGDPGVESAITKWLEGRHDVVCLNDTDKRDRPQKERHRIAQRWLKAMYPEPSSMELGGEKRPGILRGSLLPRIARG